MKKADYNLGVINAFIDWNHSDEKTRKKEREFAEIYINEDHVDGRDAEDANFEIQIGETNTDITIKTIMYGFNFHHNFIEQCWNDDKNMAQHLRSKFNGIYQHKGPDAAFFCFFTELSGHHRKKLITFINQNFKA